MKKERNPIVVVVCMLLLLTVIVLPPTFRTFFPKEEKTKQTESQDSITVLKCNRKITEDQMEEAATVRYINGKVSSNSIVYTVLDDTTDNTEDVESTNDTTQDDTTQKPEEKEEPNEDAGNAENNNATSSDDVPKDDATTDSNAEKENDTANEDKTDDISFFQTISDALEFFKSLNNINIKETDKETTVLINKKTITDNADDRMLLNFFQDKMSDQQSYYESTGYTCSIIEN